MNTKHEEERRVEFRNILYELASSSEILKEPPKRAEFYKRLEAVYHTPVKDVGKFRHYYSDVFSVLTQIQSDDSTDSTIQVLGENLGVIRNGYQPNYNTDSNGKPIDISDQIKKLYDHVSLDIARLSINTASARQVVGEDKINELKTEISNASVAINDAQKRIIALDSELKGMQKEYIAILGIFASIVLSFTAGIAFTSSVFENIHKASIYRTLIISLIIGLVLTNAIYGLFYYINKIVHHQEKQSLKPLWITNGILIGLIVCVSVAWLLGAVEWRNDFIDNRSADDTTTEISSTVPEGQTTFIETTIIPNMQTTSIITVE